jgi:hypothetical protein
MLSQLTSWTDDPRTKHFSGTGRYKITFELPGSFVADDLVLHLALGVVGNIAEVTLNGKRVGTCWMRGQCLDVTSVARAGANSLVVAVTNTLINRVSGLSELPPVPEDLRPHFGRELEGRGVHARGLIGYEPLPNSGLLGPVEIRASKRVRVPIGKGGVILDKGT